MQNFHKSCGGFVSLLPVYRRKSDQNRWKWAGGSVTIKISEPSREHKAPP
ncbi:hypothetical protein HMPREF9436_00324 [Faecalibacterium cf. prausnitzii KLE1255]|uniref:Uncharacterized protein n=1 Tax=Faecalibacterium cf. prausnitzii KLE1255 TaxID=748224 RepID=E2ZF91_9FIRM|nr:hypothetical protein HMPREF9436_00324 [Faecalibacterium cf. prausnitzii KLE1255]